MKNLGPNGSAHKSINKRARGEKKKILDKQRARMYARQYSIEFASVNKTQRGYNIRREKKKDASDGERSGLTPCISALFVRDRVRDQKWSCV